jgi:hypothetical protein
MFGFSRQGRGDDAGIANARQDRPDETYLIDSCLDPWHVWPILIDNKTYFDLAKEPRQTFWEVNQRALTPLTKR